MPCSSILTSSRFSATETPTLTGLHVPFSFDVVVEWQLALNTFYEKSKRHLPSAFKFLLFFMFEADFSFFHPPMHTPPPTHAHTTTHPSTSHLTHAHTTTHPSTSHLTHALTTTPPPTHAHTTTSKKDTQVRRSELLSYLSTPLLKWTVPNVKKLTSNNNLLLLLQAIVNNVKGVCLYMLQLSISS